MISLVIKPTEPIFGSIMPFPITFNKPRELAQWLMKPENHNCIKTIIELKELNK